MVNRNRQDFWGGNAGQNLPGGYQELPTQMGPTQFEQQRVSPTQQYVQRNVINTVVPYIHPSHLTTVNQHCINNQHYFPHTESVINECFETNTMCGTPFRPRGCNCSKRRGW
ncbi:CotD family spore coat protein [Solibacillus sp. FSL R7-0668]|uniref:CotD family spore coat protein n=1 Tax=Solibacillus sp. FSL R7-0668 TaxID=2921688 RepID=UPI004046EDED